VVAVDIRGHDSDATFASYDDVALAGDILALIDELGAPAFVVGNSMGAGAGVIAAADAPSKVSGLALFGTPRSVDHSFQRFVAVTDQAGWTRATRPRRS
jgi:pimeloyl-ACP methyl ester carboxylesterase